MNECADFGRRINGETDFERAGVVLVEQGGERAVLGFEFWVLS